MKTTAIFAEILAVGAQALIWIALAGYVFVPEMVQASWDWERIGDWAPALSGLLLLLAYTVGVIIDRIADTFVKPFRDWGELFRKAWRRLRKGLGMKVQEEPDGGRSFGEKRLEVRFAGGEMAIFLDYVRSRLRIARATVVNIALITVFAYMAAEQESTRHIVWRLGLVAVVCAYYAWAKIRSTYDKRLEQAYDLITKKSEEG